MSETYSRSYKRAVLEAAGISSSHQGEPYCTCGYCEDSRSYEEERFNKLMDAVKNTPPGDVEAEERAYQELRATGRDLDTWKPQELESTATTTH